MLLEVWRTLDSAIIDVQSMSNDKRIRAGLVNSTRLRIGVHEGDERTEQRLAAVIGNKRLPHRGVFAQLAEGWESFLMGLTDLFDDGLLLGRQLVALSKLQLRTLLLLLIAVISNSCRGTEKRNPLSLKTQNINAPSR